MKKAISSLVLLFSFIVLISSSQKKNEQIDYISLYKERLGFFRNQQKELLSVIKKTDVFSENFKKTILRRIRETRNALKNTDFWLRYLEPTAYKKINGPLPVEWETEVFEKFEAPYKRQGAGLTLAEVYLANDDINKDSLTNLINISLLTSDVFLADSITKNLTSYHHFFLANRLFILNLAAIYTTGFECPDTSNIIPELLHMLESTRQLYSVFNQSFPGTKLNDLYLGLYEKTILYVKSQPASYTLFDHFYFIQQFVNPLYRINQQMIREYKVRSSNLIDYSLNKTAASIFDKSLFTGQNGKGVFIGIDDENKLKELRETGKLLFYDPILSSNNKRSCASCHKPDQFFADTTTTTHFNFDQKRVLSRNTPSLINVVSNHLIMLDGKHINLENQCRNVITSPDEMGSTEEEVIKKVMDCNEYKSVFKKYLKTTPQYKSVTLEHIASAIMIYYTSFSSYYSPFDNAINEMIPADKNVKNGFNLFMSKAQCATCHFVPVFNGIKPPYIGSEFEIIGVPADTGFSKQSPDKGRYNINPAKETDGAFRTGTIRNAVFTKPYMHNGVFNSLEEVIDFYNSGGGAGRGLKINNQTLSSDSLHLTKNEKSDIILFIQSLTEKIPLQTTPASLPASKNKKLNTRVVGGEY